jgi:ribulose-phosphate 3-epimerase
LVLSRHPNHDNFREVNMEKMDRKLTGDTMYGRTERDQGRLTLEDRCSIRGMFGWSFRPFWIVLLLFVHDVLSKAGLPATSSTKIVIGVDGGTESIRACCFDAETGRILGQSCAVPYPTHHPHPGWAEQDPLDWYENLGQAVRAAVGSVDCDGAQETEICAVCIDTTCCSVVALDKNKEPLRPCLLWMDQRSASQTVEIMERCRGDPALLVNCGGDGPLSAEWMTPKALWIKQVEPDIWDRAETICEYQDYINFRLTNEMCASSCNAASRWHWDGELCLLATEGHPGRPLFLYKKLGIPELADKLPQRCIPMGSVVGRLTPDAASHLGLPEGIPVVQGGADAFVGMVGMGCIHPGQLCLITGSSHLHCVVTAQPTTARGTWGAYRGAPLPGVNFAEGGQSSTGSILRWAKGIFGSNDSYEDLDNAAAAIGPGADGLVALETFQGSRTPVTDALARGILIGLTLSHTKAHIWKAFMEAVCFGTRGCIEGLAFAGHKCDEIIIAGGATRSQTWLQMHADVTGKTVIVCENKDAPLVGCAILASVGVGIHNTFEDAVNSMIRIDFRTPPRPEVFKRYDEIYVNVYSQLAKAARPIVHASDHIRKKDLLNTPVIRGGHEAAKNDVVISPSLLASDWSDIKGEIQRCLKAGSLRFHVDIFDGVFLDSPYALTFGPQMVKAIRRSCDTSTDRKVALDLHVCVDRPARYVMPMAKAGATCFIFQIEATSQMEDAIALAQLVVDAGMQCGISLNPATRVEAIVPLLETGLVSVVDILAVEPGFGGQDFQRTALDKVRFLHAWNTSRPRENIVDIMVDGGINKDTIAQVLEAGAKILVAGSFLFKHVDGIEGGLQQLLRFGI